MRIGNTEHQNNPLTHMSANLAKNSEDQIRISLGNANQDHAVFSTTGKKLNLIVNDKNGIEWDTVIKGSQNHHLNTADEYISKAGTLLEQMLKITEEAKNESLSVKERLAMQTEIGRLQHELNIIGETMSMAGVGERDYAKHENFVRTQILGSYENSLAYRMLRRASERAASGGEWDVREIAHRGVWSKNEDGLAEDLNGVVNGVQEDYFGADFISLAVNEQVHGADSSKVGYIYEVTEDASAPTVKEILKSTGRSVMDASSAVETAEALKEDLAKLLEQQAKLVEIAQGDNMGDTLQQNATNFVRKVARILKSFHRESYEETVGRTSTYSRNLVHDGRNGPVFSEAFEDDESLFGNKNLSEFKPSTVMGASVIRGNLE